MISEIRGVKISIICLMLAAAGLIGGHASVQAEEQGDSPAVRSLSTGSVTGKIPFPKPDSHRGNWIEYHGASAHLNINAAGQSGKACLTCHEKNDCITCHNTRMPRDHTNTWRTLSHGFMAEGNRERCLTCHKQDYCVRCHSETAPRTHTGNWVNRHCTWCHFGSGNSIAGPCTVCHKQAAHVSAPHPVNPSLDCTLCHH